MPPLPGNRCSPELQHLLSLLLTRNPKQRPSMLQILQLPFVQHHLRRYRAHVEACVGEARKLSIRVAVQQQLVDPQQATPRQSAANVLGLVAPPATAATAAQGIAVAPPPPPPATSTATEAATPAAAVEEAPFTLSSASLPLCAHPGSSAGACSLTSTSYRQAMRAGPVVHTFVSLAELQATALAKTQASPASKSRQEQTCPASCPPAVQAVAGVAAKPSLANEQEGGASSPRSQLQPLPSLETVGAMSTSQDSAAGSGSAWDVASTTPDSVRLDLLKKVPGLLKQLDQILGGGAGEGECFVRNSTEALSMSSSGGSGMSAPAQRCDFAAAEVAGPRRGVVQEYLDTQRCSMQLASA